MSNDLYWRPAPKDLPPARSLPHGLKARLARRLWGEDSPALGSTMDVDQHELPYLEGLADGGVDGAADLVDAIREHGTIQLWIE